MRTGLVMVVLLGTLALALAGCGNDETGGSNAGGDSDALDTIGTDTGGGGTDARDSDDEDVTNGDTSDATSDAPSDTAADVERDADPADTDEVEEVEEPECTDDSDCPRITCTCTWGELIERQCFVDGTTDACATEPLCDFADANLCARFGRSLQEPNEGVEPGSKPLASECLGDAECESGICIFKGTATTGVCSQTCEGFGDCPSSVDYDCQSIQRATGKYCVPTQ